MRIIKPMVIVEDDISELAVHMQKKIEVFTRKCYKSEGKMTDDSYKSFLPKIFQTFKHEGIAEHRFVSCTFITDRGVSHEFVRHRMASYLQESTRYCDYSNKGVTYIMPSWLKLTDVEFIDFKNSLEANERLYQFYSKNLGWKPQQARYFLPNGLKTEFVATLNLGSWHNFFKKRTPVQAHPQIRQLAVPLLRYFQTHLPSFFNDIELPTLDYEEAALVVNSGYEQVPVVEVYSSNGVE